MFSSKAEKEENYQVNAEWCFDLPRGFVQFGHPAPRSFPSTVTVNSKGGTDSRVLQQVLLSYVESLYPDAKDEAGCRVIIKLDGGPGRLDMNSLAELRCRGVFCSLVFRIQPMYLKKQI